MTMTALYYNTTLLSYIAHVGNKKQIEKAKVDDLVFIGVYENNWSREDIRRFHLRKVAIFATQYRKHTRCSQSEAMLKAWQFVRETPCAKILKFWKVKNGERVVGQRLVDCEVMYTPKGTGRPLKDGQKMFVDLVRSDIKSAPMYISTYKERIIELL